MAKKLMKGCEAVAEAAIQAGCHYFFGYPITPQSEVPEYMSVHLPEHGGVFVLLLFFSCRCKVHDKLLQPRNKP